MRSGSALRLHLRPRRTSHLRQRCSLLLRPLPLLSLLLLRLRRGAEATSSAHPLFQIPPLPCGRGNVGIHCPCMPHTAASHALHHWPKMCNFTGRYVSREVEWFHEGCTKGSVLCHFAVKSKIIGDRSTDTDLIETIFDEKSSTPKSKSDRKILDLRVRRLHVMTF